MVDTSRAANTDRRAPPYAALIRSSLDALEQGITIFDADLKLVFANQSFLKLRDLPQDLGRIGIGFEDQVRFRAERGDYGPGDVETLIQDHVKLARRFEAHRVERTRADGTILAIRGDPLPGGGFIAIYSDITDRKRAEEAVVAQNAELETAAAAYERQGAEMAELVEQLDASHQQLGVLNRTKGEFLANMSHELRTPLNAIIGFSEIIKDETFGPGEKAKYRDYANDINASGKHLLDLINDVLDLSKVEAGKEELHEEAIDIPDIVRSIGRMMAARAEQGGIELAVDVPSDAPRLYADPRKLRQVLLNVLSNAIKFTHAGGKVTLKVWSNTRSGYLFQVIDTGIGIALADIPKALTPFEQVDSALNRSHQGTGLGLPLAKSLVELHGGYLDLQSEVGAGTTITMRFPSERIVHMHEDARASPG